nr:dsDNA nuclease domain-containing protein [uncultured Flavobacterium sp.]
MPNDLVAYSRAGDVFHYRWAARRCLALVYPNASLQSIVIEGSAEKEKEGEYVIDVSEYYKGDDGKKHIQYYQLKHTTVNKDDPFTLSDLKETFEGFSKRYNQHLKENKTDDICFNLVTNRPVAKSFKNQITALGEGTDTVTKTFKQTIESYTGLHSEKLAEFCRLLEFNDSEGDYNVQKDELRLEIAQLIAGTVDNAQIDSIITLVQERVLPDSDGFINPQDIFKCFGLSFEKDLFPAPALWEKAEKIIERNQHKELIDAVSNSLHPVIVHAPGGVGKSVFCRQLANSLPETSAAIAYDCFGAGQYRNRSEPRHRHRDALVQIANELAVKGLCDPLLVQDTSLDTDIMKKFLWRIEAAVKNLKKSSSSAELFILIDAADNAEMAAQEYSTSCFAGELLREKMPEGCRLVVLSRTERIDLLKPNSKIVRLELKAFDEKETLLNLRRWFKEADKKDGAEFHRLTSGNPRVQANALSVGASDVLELLSRLGPTGTTVEKQIEQQLNAAVLAVKDSLSDSFQVQIDAICLGLASLPPHIPIKILATAAKVSIETVKSFIADIGRSLWLSDDSVQFRDEPAETWFRTSFLADKKNFETYIELLEPLADEHTYAAEVLPHLYLQAEQYDKLIQTALSDKYLPQDNPIDARSVRVYRLQFAFRAALKAVKYADAIKIAVRAGEEMAGNLRQLNLFRGNIDLLAALQDKQKIQDIAFKRVLSAGWNGSENVYTASLLSRIGEYKGEARGYLRAAVNWMMIYYKELAKSDDPYPQNEISEEHILELALANFNIHGITECIDFLNRFKPKLFVFSVAQKLAERLIDAGDFKAVDDFLLGSVKNPYFTVAITGELVKTGHFPRKELIGPCLKLMTNPKKRIKEPKAYYHEENLKNAVLSFAESCLHRELPKGDILKMLEYYIPQKASRMVYDGHQWHERDTYLRVLALRVLLQQKSEPDMENILPDELATEKNENKHERDNKIRKFNEVINCLFPWYFLRVLLLSGKEIDFKDEVEKTDQKSKKAAIGRHRSYDSLPSEISAQQSSILALFSRGTTEEIKWFYENYLKQNKTLWIPNQLWNVRTAFRLGHLEFLKHELEQDAYNRIKSADNDQPETLADKYAALSRAVLISAPEDAAEYFDEAVDIVSKFGDEIVSRWSALVSVAEQSCTKEDSPEELSYRFIRCAEVVGEYVDREKYWNRSEAVAVCARMSSGTAVAALSRWRDRDIGRFRYQLEALLHELVESDKISPEAGWAMARFFSDHELKDFLSLCLEKAQNQQLKLELFSDSMRLLQRDGSSARYWDEMKQLGLRENIREEILNEIEDWCGAKNMEEPQNTDSKARNEADKDKSNIDWDAFFGSLDIFESGEFERIFESFKALSEKSFYREKDYFWEEIVKRLTSQNFSKFIQVLMTAEVGRYDIKPFFNSLPQVWKNKISYKKNWSSVIRQMGRKYSRELASPYSIKYFTEEFEMNGAEVDELKEGIFEGLSDGYDFSEAETFFGFVDIAAPLITQEDAEDLLDFGLARFELHVENDFGDGPWAEWLLVSKDVNNQIAGFIWSALGSPKSKERWNAVHCVRLLTEFNCTEIIDELFKWMQFDKTAAFGSIEFPFYNLHARLYFLIAMARISLYKAESLLPFKDVFVQYAFGEPHVLIQKFAAETAVNISHFFIDAYDEEELKKIKAVGKSDMPVIKTNYHDQIDSYWHTKKKIAVKYDFHFGWDFDRYWFEPLGDVFGISGKQVEDIAADVIINQWGFDKKNGWKMDPRAVIWNRYEAERETWHDHGSYPRTDDLDFYLSYHSMMAAAAKLLEKMPVVSSRDWDDDDEDENNWDYWLSGHILTSPDGKWLSDYRDPLPIVRPQWISENKMDNWKDDVSEKCFFDTLTAGAGNENGWINVYGRWTEKLNERDESISIASALVSKDTSHALIRALQTCSDPHDYKLPEYEERRMEIDSDSFQLKGWIRNVHRSKGIDQYDPYAEDIDYPALIIGTGIVDKLKLLVKDDGKHWYLPSSSMPALKCETWSNQQLERDESPNQCGSRLKATVTFLKQLCTTFDCHVIFEVEIKRDISNRYRNRDDDYEYSKPLHKLFILSSDGELRTTETDYRLR